MPGLYDAADQTVAEPRSDEVSRGKGRGLRHGPSLLVEGDGEPAGQKKGRIHQPGLGREAFQPDTLGDHRPQGLAGQPGGQGRLLPVGTGRSGHRGAGNPDPHSAKRFPGMRNPGHRDGAQPGPQFAQDPASGHQAA